MKGIMDKEEAEVALAEAMGNDPMKALKARKRIEDHNNAVTTTSEQIDLTSIEEMEGETIEGRIDYLMVTYTLRETPGKGKAEEDSRCYELLDIIRGMNILDDEFVGRASVGGKLLSIIKVFATIDEIERLYEAMGAAGLVEVVGFELASLRGQKQIFHLEQGEDQSLLKVGETKYLCDAWLLLEEKLRAAKPAEGTERAEPPLGRGPGATCWAALRVSR